MAKHQSAEWFVGVPWLLTDKPGEVVLDYIKTRMRVHNDLGIVSFCEPHKIAQNSLTIIRLTIIRKTAIKNRTYDDKSALRQDTVQFLRNFVAQQKSMRGGARQYEVLLEV